MSPAHLVRAPNEQSAVNECRNGIDKDVQDEVSAALGAFLSSPLSLLRACHSPTSDEPRPGPNRRPCVSHRGPNCRQGARERRVVCQSRRSAQGLRFHRSLACLRLSLPAWLWPGLLGSTIVDRQLLAAHRTRRGVLSQGSSAARARGSLVGPHCQSLARAAARGRSCLAFAKETLYRVEEAVP